MDKRWYRYYDYIQASDFDSDGDLFPGKGILKIALTTYDEVRSTPKGVWIGIGQYSTGEHFILLRAKKKFAQPSKREALESYIARKKRQIKIVKNQLDRAETALSKACAMENGLED